MKIHQVKGRHVNSYVIEDGDGLLVVDAAWRGEKYVLGYIHKVLQRDIRDVKLVICTHGDPDHSGSIARVASACGAKLAVPYATPSKLLKFANDPTGMIFRLVTALIEGMRPRAWVMYANPHKSARAKMLPAYTGEDGVANDERTALAEPPLRLKHHTLLPGFEDWQVIHTPGHSWDSCCYFHLPSGSLITGDTLLGSNKKGHPVKPSVYANPVQLARSVKLLRRLKPQAVYPGHGACFRGAGLLDHLKRGGVKG
ncbi:MAG: MBL fold metallo-hydrolase [Porticoccaceae bacterium]|nr:MBL fold metallo-hydrolase [Porticoccaceae bacterium]